MTQALSKALLSALLVITVGCAGRDIRPDGPARVGDAEPEEPRRTELPDAADAAEPGEEARQAERAPDFEGFAPGRLALQRQSEAEIRRAARADRCEADLKELTKFPHVAGSERNAELARFLSRSLEKAGFSVEKRSYEVLLPYPKTIAVEMEQPVAFSASLVEEAAEYDLDTQHQAITPYLAYSPDCDLSRPVVYANYARREDFEKLRELGVRVRDRIVLARYGHIFRGSKVALAEEFGAAALVLYSDPADDGYGRGDAYPRGPFRPFTGVERGSLLRIWDYPGDPGTPGRASVAGARQLTYGEMRSLPNIPATCISAADAKPIIEHLGGQAVPEGWRGALPGTYHLGGMGKVVLRLRIESDYALRRIENVIGTLPGQRFPDEFVMLGNHRDAWVHGASDAGSGTAVLLETARLLGEARAAGKGLDRSVRIGFFDAEEFGIIGSTEYGEEVGADLQKNCVAYLNVDTAVSGPDLSVAGVPSLRSFLGAFLAGVNDLGERPGLDRLRQTDGKIRIRDIGAGGDYTVFLAHLGIPCIDLASSGKYGVYHSSYDTYVFMKRFGDPGFKAHRGMAGLIASLTSRLARAELLPFDFAGAARELAAAADRMEAKRPDLDLSEIREIATDVEKEGRLLNERRALLLERNLAIERTMLFNRELRQIEQKLLLAGGYPQRPWYRHALHAPDPDRGYGTMDLALLQDALATGDRDAVQTAARQLTTALRAWRQAISRIAAMMESR